MTETKWHTTRLVLDFFTTADGSNLYKLMNSPGWLRFIGDRNIDSEETAVRYLLDRIGPSFEKYGFGLLRVSHRSTGEFIGMCGILQRNNLPAPDLGFALLPEYEGMGYMREATSLVMDLAKNEWNLKSCYAMTDPVNVKAQRLLDRLKFVYDPHVTATHAQEGLYYYVKDLQATEPEGSF